MQTIRHRDGATDILRPYTGGQSESDVIADGDGIVFIFEWDHREHWAKDLFLGNAHGIFDAAEYRRLDKPTVAAFRPRGLLAPEQGLRAFALGDIDIIEHFLVLRLVGDRSDLCVETHRVTHLRGFGEGHELIDELVMNALLHEQPRSGDAGLTGGGEDPGDYALNSVVHVRIVEHDVRRFAAELEADAL